MNRLTELLGSSPRWPWGAGRIMLGLMWLATLRWKLPPNFEPTEGTRGVKEWLELQVANPGLSWYGDIIDSVVLPNFTLFAWMLFFLELFVGLSLLLGIFTRPAALIGLGMSLNLWIGLRNIEWHWTYVLMAAWHLAIVISPYVNTWSLQSVLPDGLARLSGLGNGLAQGTDGIRGSLAAATLRITLGVITLVTWKGNVDSDFYDGENFPGFFDWVSKPVEDGGNGASLGFVHSLVDATVLQAPEFIGWFMTFFELFVGVGLLFGIFTRAASLAAVGFFGSLLLVYFGGHEWIFIYVMLTAAAGAVFFGWGGRQIGVDQALANSRGESPATLLW